jgi:SNF2 family DNA or RNA helicase
VGEIIHALRKTLINDPWRISLYPDDPWRFDLSTEKGCREWIERSARLAKTMEILRDIDRRGEKALVFVEHRFMQERFAEAATTLFGLDDVPFIINGAMPGVQRQKRVNEFQARRNRFDLMILSPKAAGVGLTITAANHVIHLSRWWNPAVEDQCNDRVYRIGQNKSVQIHIPMAEHPLLGERTFDLTLDRLLTRKRALSRTLLAPPITDSDLGDVYREAVDVREAA